MVDVKPESVAATIASSAPGMSKCVIFMIVVIVVLIILFIVRKCIKSVMWCPTAQPATVAPLSDIAPDDEDSSHMDDNAINRAAMTTMARHEHK